MPPEKGYTVTEGERFSVQPMATDLTIECARRFLKALMEKGGDKVEDDIVSGRATKDFTPEEIASWKIR